MKLRATGFASTPPDFNECRRALAVLIGPGATFELRALPAGRSAICRSADEAIVAIRGFAHAAGVYYTLNPCPTDLDRAARNSDILSRSWLLIDIDPDRPADQSSTDDEKATAAQVACAIVDDLAARGWPSPILVDSGNGFHILYRIDLPNNKLAQQWIKKVLVVLAERHDIESAHVDRSVHNAARIAKLPGTWARKGPDTPDRPHRLARLAMVPDTVEVVSVEQIRALIGPDKGPDQGPDPTPLPGDGSTTFRVRATAGSKDAYCRAALQGECVRVATAINHTRHITLNLAAFKLGTLLHLDGFDRAEAERSLLAAARRVGLPEREIADTIRDGLDAGIMEPREVPDNGRCNGKANGRNSSGPTVLPDPDSVKFTGQSGRVYDYPLIISGENVEPKRVRWLWDERIAFGFLSLMAGRTGVGKSFIALDVTARITVGGLIPLSACECFDQGNCLIISEDSYEYVLAPRLIEGGADMSRVKFMSWNAMAAFTLGDVEMLEDTYQAAGSPIFVVIDPPTNFLGAKDEHKNAEVRGVLMGISIWAMRHDLACILITHCNKGLKKDMAALDRIIGSVAWGTTSRIAHLVAPHPDEADQCVFIPLKNNIGRKAEGIAYRINPAPITATVEWIGTVDFSADEAMGGEKKKSKGMLASEWLTERFRERREWPSDELKRCAKEAGYNHHSLWSPQVNALPIDKKPHFDATGTRYWVWTAQDGWPPEKIKETSERSESKPFP